MCFMLQDVPYQPPTEEPSSLPLAALPPTPGGAAAAAEGPAGAADEPADGHTESSSHEESESDDGSAPKPAVGPAEQLAQTHARIIGEQLQPPPVVMEQPAPQAAVADGEPPVDTSDEPTKVKCRLHVLQTYIAHANSHFNCRTMRDSLLNLH